MESNESKCQEQCTLIISDITFRDCRVHIFPTTFLEIAVYHKWIVATNDCKI